MANRKVARRLATVMMLVCKHDKGYVLDLVVLARLYRSADLYDNPAFIIYIRYNYVINTFR